VDKAIKSVPSRPGRMWLLMMSETNLLKKQLVVVMVDAKVLCLCDGTGNTMVFTSRVKKWGLGFRVIFIYLCRD